MQKRFWDRILYLFLARHGPELDYIVGTLINDLTNRLKHNDSIIQLSPDAQTGVIVAWNYMDAVYDLMLALIQISDKKDYRHRESMVKGIINIFAAVEMFVLSYNQPLVDLLGISGGPTALAGSSFFVSMITDFLVTHIDFRATTKKTHFSGWLDEKLREYRYNASHGYSTEAIEGDLLARLSVYIGNNPRRLNEMKGLIARKCPNQIERGPSFFRLSVSQEVEFKYKERDQDIQTNADRQYHSERSFMIIKIVTLVGMGLLALQGFMEPSETNDPTKDSTAFVLFSGLVLTNFVAAYYLFDDAITLWDNLIGSNPAYYTI